MTATTMVPVADRAATIARQQIGAELDSHGSAVLRAVLEQRPRMQSRAAVVTLGQGDGVIFPVHHRPVRGSKGVYRATMRHGVSRLRSGQRHTRGIIFHDAH
jgi:hypothetical protein